LNLGGKTAQQEDNRTVTQPISAENWRNHAACLGIGGDVFYPRDDDETKLQGQPETTRATGNFEAAKAICRTCMVCEECLMYAIENGEQHGIWGGMSLDERRRERKRLGIPYVYPPTIWIHGTRAGYRRHLRANEPACRECIDAETTGRNEERTKRKGLQP